MNCNETQTWLLRSESPALPPPPLAEHMRRCAACQRVQHQLVLVETHLQSAPMQLVPPAVRAQLMESISVAPVVVPVTRSLVKRRRRRLPIEHIVGYLAAAAASVMVGGLLGYGYAERNRPAVAVVTPPPVAPQVAEVPKVVPPPDAPTVTPEAPETKVTPQTIARVPETGTQELVVDPSVNLTQESTAVPMVDPDVTVPMAFPDAPSVATTSLADARLLNDEELLETLVDSHTKVAAVITAQDRLINLASLSDVLWTQAIKEAEATASAGNLDWLGETYATIVESDLPALARELPVSQKEAAMTLATRMEERAQEVGRLLVATTPAPQAEVFRQLQASAQASADRLAKREPSVPKQRRSGGNTNLLPLVVEETVAIAREENPIERADHSTIIAEGIAKDILVTSLRGDEDRASALGGHFGRMLEQGIAANLKRIDTSKATYQQSRRYQQVVARTQQSILFLQQSLEAAPPGAKESLTLAMQQGGLAQLVPPPGPTRRVWIWVPANFRWPHSHHHHHRRP